MQRCDSIRFDLIKYCSILSRHPRATVTQGSNALQAAYLERLYNTAPHILLRDRFLVEGILLRSVHFWSNFIESNVTQPTNCFSACLTAKNCKINSSQRISFAGPGLPKQVFRGRVYLDSIATAAWVWKMNRHTRVEIFMDRFSNTVPFSAPPSELRSILYTAQSQLTLRVPFYYVRLSGRKRELHRLLSFTRAEPQTNRLPLINST